MLEMICPKAGTCGYKCLSSEPHEKDELLCKPGYCNVINSEICCVPYTQPKESEEKMSKYYCLADNGTTPPKRAHDTCELAAKEAIRLLETTPAQEVRVLEAVKVVKCTPKYTIEDV